MYRDGYPQTTDPWATSMAHHGELIVPCLNAAGARSVVEIGAFAGELTRVLLDWAARSGALVSAIDPAPQPRLEELERSRPQLHLVRAPSLEALRELPPADAVVVDGDHNYFTVCAELALVEERAGPGGWPLVLLHDVAWPHARRDDYFDAGQVPAEARHTRAGNAGGLFPGVGGLLPNGLPYPRSAAQEGGPRNGVLTAVEDFVATRPQLALAVIPAFFGLGVIWSREAPWADAVERIVAPYDRNPLVERLEANRVLHLAWGHTRLAEVLREKELHSAQDALLRRMLDSSAFGLAERLSRLRVRAGIVRSDVAVTKAAVRRALGR